MSDCRHQGGQEYELRLRALADDALPIIRLRHVAKGRLRQHGFRLTSCRDVWRRRCRRRLTRRPRIRAGTAPVVGVTE